MQVLSLTRWLNQVRAAIQTLVPKENKYIEPEIKFNRHTFVRNVMRVKSVIVDVIEFGKYIEYGAHNFDSFPPSCCFR